MNALRCIHVMNVINDHIFGFGLLSLSAAAGLDRTQVYTFKTQQINAKR